MNQTAEQLEQNTSQLTGQVEELGEAYRVARGEAAGAQKTADEAKAGVESTQNRISALDSFTEVKLETVNFGFDSSELSDDARRQLDGFVAQVEGNKGFLIEVVGFASPEGNEAYNRRLSQKRADAVVSYLVEEHNVPLRRILRPYGFGEKRLISEEPGRDARAQNRRVEIRLLKSEGYAENSQSASIG